MNRRNGSADLCGLLDNERGSLDVEDFMIV